MIRIINCLSAFAWIACLIEAILYAFWHVADTANQRNITKITAFVIGFFALPLFLKGNSIARNKDHIKPKVWFIIYAIEIIIYVPLYILVVFK